MKDLKTAIRETGENALDTEKSVTLNDVADQVIQDYPELVATESRRLLRDSIMRLSKSLIQSRFDDGPQMRFAGFPAVLIVPDGQDSYKYMRIGKSTFEDLEAARAVRVENVQRAQYRLDQYDEALEGVRPFMEGTTRTLAETLELLPTRPITGEEEAEESTDAIRPD